MSKPNIKPISVKQYDVKQSKYDQVPKIPCRSILLGSSNSGKGILLQNLILDIYRDCFERVYVFSPSIFVDHTNKAITDYLDSKIQLSEDEPPLYYDHYDADSLERIITTQRKIIEHQKTKKEMLRNHFQSQLLWMILQSTRLFQEIVNYCIHCTPGADIVRYQHLLLRRNLMPSQRYCVLMLMHYTYLD